MRAQRDDADGSDGARPLLWRTVAVADLAAMASAAGAQAVRWERTLNGPVGGSGPGFAYAAPGVVIAARNTSMTRWTSAYAVSSGPLGGRRR